MRILLVVVALAFLLVSVHSQDFNSSIPCTLENQLYTCGLEYACNNGTCGFEKKIIFKISKGVVL
jgi:hypothetical protein